MKILVICKALECAYAGGIQTHVTDLTEMLVARGHQVHLLTAGNPFRRGQHNKSAVVTVLPYLPKWLCFGLTNTLGDLSFNLIACIWVQLYGSNFDIIHAQGRSGIALHRCDIEVPVIQTIHAMASMENGNTRVPVLHDLDRRLHLHWAHQHQKYMVGFCHKLITVSEDTASRFADTYSDQALSKLQVIPNGILHFDDQCVVAAGLRRVLFVGRLSDTKGVDVLIKGMRHVHKDLHLDIVGDGPQKQKLQTLASELNLSQRISFEGRKSRKEAYRYIQNCFALVAPSTYEPQGIVLLEAAAMGKAIIAADTNGIPEFIEHGINGLLISTDDPSEVATAINELYMHPGLASRLGAKARDKAHSRYRWEDLCDQIISTYKSCAA